MVVKLSEQEMRTLVGITNAEAGGESPIGQAAVMHVVLNRLESGKYGGTVDEVVYAPSQFEPTSTAAGRARINNIPPEKEAQLRALAEAVVSGQVADPTGGATHFSNMAVMEQRGGANGWQKAMMDTRDDIGNHSFFGGDPEKAAQVRDQLRSQGLNILSKWQNVLNSASTPYLIEELKALDSEDAKKSLEALETNPSDEAARKDAVKLISENGKPLLQKAGLPTTSRNATLAGMRGGATAVRLLQAEQQNPQTALTDIVKDESMLAATKALIGKDPSKMTIGEFLGSVEEVQQNDKNIFAESARKHLSPEGQGWLNDLMGQDMGITDFIMIFFLMLFGDALGIPMSAFGLGQGGGAEPAGPSSSRPGSSGVRGNSKGDTEAYRQGTGGAPIAAGAVTAADGSPPQAFIVHHTGGGGTVEGVQATLKQRGLSVQYVMDKEGNIFQTGGPGSQHMLPGWGDLGKGLSNANTVGMEIIAADDDHVTPKQVAAAKAFIEKYYPNTPVYGHGQVNPGHKQHDEGLTVVNTVLEARQNNAASADSSVRLSYNDVPGGLASVTAQNGLPATVAPSSSSARS